MYFTSIGLDRLCILAFTQYGIVAWQTWSCQDHLWLFCRCALPRQVHRAVPEFTLHWRDVLICDNRTISRAFSSSLLPPSLSKCCHEGQPWAPSIDEYLAFFPKGLFISFSCPSVLSHTCPDNVGLLKCIHILYELIPLMSLSWSCYSVSACWSSSAHFGVLGMTKLEVQSFSRLNSVAMIIALAPIFQSKKTYFLQQRE